MYIDLLSVSLAKEKEYSWISRPPPISQHVLSISADRICFRRWFFFFHQKKWSNATSYGLYLLTFLIFRNPFSYRPVDQQLPLYMTQTKTFHHQAFLFTYTLQIFSWTDSTGSKDEKNTTVRRTRRCQRFKKIDCKWGLVAVNFEPVFYLYIRPTGRQPSCRCRQMAFSFHTDVWKLIKTLKWDLQKTFYLMFLFKTSSLLCSLSSIPS